MRLKPVIDRLREQVPTLRIVGGGVDLAKLTTTPATPAAYVVPLRDNPQPNRGVNAVIQTVEHRFGVLLVVRDVSKAQGEAAHDDALDELRQSVFAALLGWQHPDADGVLAYAGGGLQAFDGGVLYWAEEFTVDSQLRAT